MSHLIVIRGNSGSGKTTVANALHEILGEGNLLISQDYVRRTMLKVKDKPNNQAVGLIESLINYGIQNCQYTIVEGILANNKYGIMLKRVLKKADRAYVYYYDLPFEETVRRHKTKVNTDFDTNQMHSWFTEHDFIGIENEKTIKREVSKDDMVELILDDLEYC